jgi:hypothetical protein
MLKSIRFGIGAALLAAAHLASAGSAEVQVSNFTLSVSGGEWWYWLPANVDWLAPTAGASSALMNPGVVDSSTGWHGGAFGASVSDGGSSAAASLGAATGSDLNGVSAAAHVVANDGQMGWAFAKVFDGQIMVGGHATITVSATVDTIHASGTTAQADAYIQLCGDLTPDSCDFANYAEAFVDAGSGSYSGPSIISASWTNPGETTWAMMHIGLTASAETDVTPVPEPGTWALMLAGLAGVGALRRRRCN